MIKATTTHGEILTLVLISMSITEFSELSTAMTSLEDSTLMRDKPSTLLKVIQKISSARPEP